MRQRCRLRGSERCRVTRGPGRAAGAERTWMLQGTALDALDNPAEMRAKEARPHCTRTPAQTSTTQHNAHRRGETRVQARRRTGAHGGARAREGWGGVLNNRTKFKRELHPPPTHHTDHHRAHPRHRSAQGALHRIKCSAGPGLQRRHQQRRPPWRSDLRSG